MIREAHQGDLKYLEKLAEAFVKESGFSFTYNQKKTRDLIWSFFGDKDKIVYVIVDLFDVPVGMVAGVVTSPYFSNDLFAQEIVWYVEKNYRGGTSSLKLLKTYEQWAKRMGATQVQVSNIEELKGSSVSEVYERLGYKKVESAFLKEI